MLKSRLLYYDLLIGLATIQAWAKGGLDGPGAVSDNPAQALDAIEAVIWERVQYVVVEREGVPRRVILDTLPNPTALPARQVRCLQQMPAPTPPPQKRQDQGQINALSGEIQRLSQSISFVSSTISSISSSAQSVRQSADQAVRSANQNADQANQALSRTQSSASSAIAQASQQANDRISQTSSLLSSSFSANLDRLSSSAKSEMSVAMASASRSVDSIMSAAASQIQQARADASGVRGDANNLIAQVQNNSVSAQNFAIIVSVSVVGSVIATTIISFLVLRCRRNGRRNREAAQGFAGLADEKSSASSSPYDDGKPIAVQGAPPSPVQPDSARFFNPQAGGTNPTEKLKLPGFAANQEGSNNVDMATSDNNQKPDGTMDVYGVSSQSFRLQKPPNIRRAETVRIIRVNSRKQSGEGRRQQQQQQQQQPPKAEQTPPETPTQREIPAPPQLKWPEPSSPAPKSPLPQVPQQQQKQRQSTPPRQQQQRQSTPPRPIAAQPPSSTVTPKAVPEATGGGLRPPSSTGIDPRASLISAAGRFKFRDSIDTNAEPPKVPEVPGTSAPTAGVAIPVAVAVAVTDVDADAADNRDEQGLAESPPQGRRLSMIDMMSDQGMGPSMRPGVAPAIYGLRQTSSEALDEEPIIPPSLLPSALPPPTNPVPAAPGPAPARTGPSFTTFPTVRKQAPAPPTVLKTRPRDPPARTSAELFWPGLQSSSTS